MITNWGAEKFHRSTHAASVDALRATHLRNHIGGLRLLGVPDPFRNGLKSDFHAGDLVILCAGSVRWAGLPVWG